ncbi:inositol monophosphatase family protein [Roseinatronobacter alkalisoli]|uniref:Inositol monophosphatase n=1 Tax=Roseinatronobacter alkalisoli TaxID=3028235 RepID=A0ABT5T6N0_9RHOB|nr:inositol monophosphatase [Roseinatronobacter sp. HJB301]MDD7970626.1 inositol monophosphatase [Roseinatronobacter sp. HJB301]
MTHDDSLAARFALAQTAARAAGAHALALFHDRASLTIETKHDALDMVSRADREAEDVIRAMVSEAFPEDGFLGEEGGAQPGTSGLTWVIDPIDGTVPFVSGLPHWCVAIGIQSEQATEVGVVYQPILDEMFTARRGAGAALNGVALRISPTTRLTNSLTGIGANHRAIPEHVAGVCCKLMAQGGMFYRNGSGALMLASVAAGRLGGYYEPHMHPWDCLAGLLLVREAGGQTLPMPDGASLAEGGEVLAAAPAVWPDLAAITGHS